MSQTAFTWDGIFKTLSFLNDKEPCTSDKVPLVKFSSIKRYFAALLFC